MRLLFKFIHFLILAVFITVTVDPCAYAQAPVGGVVSLSAPTAPCILRGIKINVHDPLKLDLLFDEGDKVLSPETFQDESLRLIRYFLASLTIPASDLWVNLSPYENDRIVQEDFGRTGMGRDLLQQDYILKQLSASLLYPDSTTGKDFWAKVYAQAYEKFGTTDIPVDTFNKVWIVPEASVVYESLSPDKANISAFVDQMKLKVMLESDYLAARITSQVAEPPAKWPQARQASDTQDFAKDIIRQVVLPVLEKEVNEGASFAPLRQICHSLVLSVWLKKKLIQSAQQAVEREVPGGNVLAAVYVDRHKTGGIEIADPKVQTHQIYEQYLQAYKKGAYNLIREEVDAYSQEVIPRKYFSGGFDASQVDKAMQTRNGNSWRPSGKYAHNRYRKQSIELRAVIKKIIGWTVIGLMVGAVGYGLWGGFKKNDVKAPPSVGRQVTEDLLARQKEQKVAEYVAMLEQITVAQQEFESGLINRAAAKISTEDFFKRVLAEKTTPSMTAQDNQRVISQMAWRLSQMIDRDFEHFGGSLKAAGLSSTDVARLLFSLMIRESRGDMLAEQIIGKKVQARGALQDEYLTWWTKLHVAQDELKGLPKEFQEFYDGVQKFDSKIKDELQNKRGSTKNNQWTSRSAGDMVVDPEAHIRMGIIWMNYMVGKKALPIEAVMAEADQVSGITLSPNAVAALRVSSLSFNELVDNILTRAEYAGHDRKQTQMILLSVLWNGGVNRTPQELMEIYRFIFSEYDGRIAYQKKANEALKITEKKRLMAMASAKNAIPLKLRHQVDLKKVFLFTSDRGRALKGLLGKFSPAEEKVFARAWEKYRLAEKDMFKAQWQQRVWKSATYGEICSVLGQYGQVKKDLTTIADEYRGYRDTGGQGTKELRKVRAAQNILKMPPSKVLPKKKQSRPSKKDRAQSYGGIDLSAQAGAMQVVGQAGSFDVSLSAQQVALNKDDVQGFLPIIISTQLVNDVGGYLGFGQGLRAAP